jgi:hypothetical protein
MSTLPQEMTEKSVARIRERELDQEERDSKPWTAPDFVERSTCAEIGAYSFQQK